MKDYISTLQSQIARNSVEIKHKEFIVRIAKAQVIDAAIYCKQECKTNLSLAKKTLKKLVENQKTLKKLKTQLVLLDNLYGEEDW